MPELGPTLADSSAALDWLFAQQERGIHPGLARVEALLSHLGNPERSFRAVQVGGTNGKGSTTRFLSSILQAAGWTPVGEYTSPHLHRFNERVRVDGKVIDDSDLVDIAGRLASLHHQVPATFFELVTALAFEHFRRQGVRWAALEVGMGGRLDATTAAPAEMTVITGVSLDHTSILGSTVEEIAEEKAGIIRLGRPVLTGATGIALEVIRSRAAEVGSPMQVLGEDIAWTGHITDGGQKVSVTSRYGSTTGKIALSGAFQARNAALAAAAALELGIAGDAIARGLASARWPGRLELMAGEPDFLLDAAHNPEGAAELARYVSGLGRGQVTLVVAGLADKDLAGVAAELTPIAGLVVATMPRHSPRAASPTEIAAHYPGAITAPDPVAAIELAREITPPDGLVVVAGTIPLIAQVRESLLGVEGEDRERQQ